MKYKGNLKYPQVGDEIEIKKYGMTYTVSSLSKNGLSQGDLVIMGYEKGVHCFMCWVKNKYNKEWPLLKRVYTDELQPKVGSYSIGCPSFCESPKEFFEKYREKYAAALEIIDEYREKHAAALKIIDEYLPRKKK